MCPPAIIGEHKVKAVGANKVTFDCDRRGVKLGDNRLNYDFTLGLNGVIYLIDNVLTPDRGKNLFLIFFFTYYRNHESVKYKCLVKK